MQVAGLLKRWLESLPDPLLSWNAQVDILSCLAIQSIKERTAALREVVSQVRTKNWVTKHEGHWSHVRAAHELQKRSKLSAASTFHRAEA